MREQTRKVLLITLEPVAEKMAGPAIRSLEIGRQLADEFSVTVFTPQPSKVGLDPAENPGNFNVVCGGGRTKLHTLSEEADVLFIQANVLKPFPSLTRAGKFLVVDLYDPYLFSLFEQYEHDPVTASSSFRLMHQVLEKHMLAADFSVCASERQRDYWIGRFCALGRISPEVYDLDKSLRNLIDVVPFGVQNNQPKQVRHGIRGSVPGIAQDDQILLWGGGIWDWFDPLTIIRAVDRLKDRLPKLRLFFMGVKSPNPQVPMMDMVRKAKELAQELGLLDKFVFFCEEWISYDERADYLLDADLAVSAHFDVIETRYSFRTRILDYFWAGLPILTTAGDDLADVISTGGAGFAIAVKDEARWAEAIVELLENDELRQKCKAASKELAESFHWSKVVSPLRQYCRQPHRLPEFTRVTMPSLLERAHAVYSRGGKELVIQRSKQLLGDLLR